MIIEAIGALDEAGGSTEETISTFITSSILITSADHPRLVNENLNQLIGENVIGINQTDTERLYFLRNPLPEGHQSADPSEIPRGDDSFDQWRRHPRLSIAAKRPRTETQREEQKSWRSLVHNPFRKRQLDNADGGDGGGSSHEQWFENMVNRIEKHSGSLPSSPLRYGHGTTATTSSFSAIGVSGDSHGGQRLAEKPCGFLPSTDSLKSWQDHENAFSRSGVARGSSGKRREEKQPVGSLPPSGQLSVGNGRHGRRNKQKLPDSLPSANSVKKGQYHDNVSNNVSSVPGSVKVVYRRKVVVQPLVRRRARQRYRSLKKILEMLKSADPHGAGKQQDEEEEEAALLQQDNTAAATQEQQDEEEEEAAGMQMQQEDKAAADKQYQQDEEEEEEEDDKGYRKRWKLRKDVRIRRF
uniref:Uncharacterized protein n=1 Tax=Nelumbo nucifera TaxID=4432 RepID=A0A822YIW3_NELNU|nr:TPA_asm: hypothetical protein HUJ06_010914 [Nelumbo nucifera]